MAASGDPPRSAGPTAPDPLDPDARAALDLLEDERIARCWRVPFGFLVMTNLRCVYVWKKAVLFRKSDWQTGPTFFFYNLATPRVVARRFVELWEDPPFSAGGFRFLVQDPVGVCAEIEAARPAGRAAWEARSARAPVDRPWRNWGLTPPGATVVIREIVKIRCSYCGGLMDSGSKVCPACGAPQ